MRFKENREEFSGQGFEYTERGPRSSEKVREIDREEKIQSTKIKSEEKRQYSIPKMKKSEIKKSPSKSKKKLVTEHIKSDGTPDMRFKENRDEFTGQGYQGTTSLNKGLSKANNGIYEGNTPGEHSGKYDVKGHHLKNDGTPDMRFKENREEFVGKGYEHQKLARYKQDENTFKKKIYYRRKRPPTPYALYIRERASAMKKDNPEMDMNQVFRILADEWRKSTEKEHKKYYNMYEEEIRRWEEQNKYPHRGTLSTRKFAESRGLNMPAYYASSKRGKNYYGNKKLREFAGKTQENDKDEDENYNPEEENISPNEK
jgi:hypothetical protein